MHIKSILVKWFWLSFLVVGAVAHQAQAQSQADRDGWFPNFGLRNLTKRSFKLPFGTTMSFYGQASPVAMLVDDGVGSDGTLADNNHSVSRIGAIIQRKPNGRIFQFRFETSLGARNSADVSQLYQGKAFDWDKSDIRFVDFSWQFDNGAVVSVGQGSMATDGVTNLDLSRTNIANSVSIPDIGGGYRFRTTTGALSTIQINDVFQTFDGIRRARVRYDTRDLKGLRFSVSAGAEVFDSSNDDLNADAAIHYEKKLKAVHIQAALGQSVSKTNGETTRSDTVGSATVLHKPSGLNATVAGGVRINGGDYIYIKLGYISNIFPLGSTAFAIDFQNSENVYTKDSIASAFGIAVVQYVEKLDVSVFVGYRKMSYSDGSPTEYRDVGALFAGARWNF